MEVRWLALFIFPLFLLACNAGVLNTSSIYTSAGYLMVCTGNGLAISSDGGRTFNLRTAANSGLFTDTPDHVNFYGSDIYASFNSNVSVSHDGGATFATRGFADGITSGPLEEPIWVRSDGVPFIGFDTGIYTSADNGITYTMIPGLTQAVYAIYGLGNYLYAAETNVGLHIASAGGAVFTSLSTTANGLPSNTLNSIAASTSRLYVGSSTLGLGVSSDNGASFITKTIVDGLASNAISSISTGSGNYVFVGTDSGLSVSSNNGSSFTNKTTMDGLPSNIITEVAYSASARTLFVLTNGGIAKSTNDGRSFTTIDTSSYFSPIAPNAYCLKVR